MAGRSTGASLVAMPNLGTADPIEWFSQAIPGF
jgi:hypothetical protein